MHICEAEILNLIRKSPSPIEVGHNLAIIWLETHEAKHIVHQNADPVDFRREIGEREHQPVHVLNDGRVNYWPDGAELGAVKQGGRGFKDGTKAPAGDAVDVQAEKGALEKEAGARLH